LSNCRLQLRAESSKLKEKGVCKRADMCLEGK
jgi:hypothetical protein